MLFDKQNCFSWNQSLIQSAGTYYSDTLDLGAPGTIYLPPLLGSNPTQERDLGRGEEVQVLAVITSAVASATGTLNVSLIQGDTVDGSNNISGGTTIFTTGALGQASWPLGKRLSIRSLPWSTKGRYLQFTYVIGTAALTAGTITAAIVDQTQTNQVGL